MPSAVKIVDGQKSGESVSDRIAEKISVCLLTYNHVEVVESTLMSILDQTITGYEVIVSDDCSTDGTWERILQLAAEDARIKPARTPRNMGMPGNANFAVAQCSRHYVALLHHDDLYRKDLLEKWAGVLDRYPDVAFVFNPYGVFESDFIYEEAMPSERIDGRWFLRRHLLAHWDCAVRGTAMIRREAWKEVGGMREQFGLLADIDLWMRLAMRWSVGYVPEPVITVRHQRPSYYPDIYAGKAWSWRRRRYVYEIHAANRRALYVRPSIGNYFMWLLFRARLSAETTKWLAYAVVRKKYDMLATSHLGAVPEELAFVRWLRALLVTLYASK